MKRNMKQWVADVIAGEKKQAVPVLSFPGIQLVNTTVRELVADGDLQNKAMKAVADRCPTGAAVSMMDLSVEAEAFGAEIRYSDDEVPTVIGAVLEEPEDADALKVPPMGAGRTGIYVDAIHRFAEEVTDRPVFAGVIGPYSLAGRLMGMTEIMINCYEEPEMVHTTLEKASQFITRYILAFKEAGANGVMMAEPAAGLLSPELMEEFSATYVQKIIADTQDDDFAVIYHNCGNAVDKMIPQLRSLGAAGYHFGNAVDMLTMVEGMPGDVLVMGNVDPAGMFRNGTAQQVYDATIEVMKKCCGHKNYVISSGCDIPPATSWENIDSFFKAVDDFYSRG